MKNRRHSQARSATLGFYGGIGSVTGANFLLDTGEQKILVDCGLVQGDRFAAARNAEPFGYDPAGIGTLIVTHAHADHIGRIPQLVRDGFRGTIYSTVPTRALAEVMLYDALAIMQSEARERNEEPLYGEEDIAAALAQWKGIVYRKRVPLDHGVSFMLRNAGHVLGSAFVELEREGRQVVFSGDIGNVPQPLLDAPDIPKGYHYLVMESVYGDRRHEGVEERGNLLLEYIEDTIRERGTLIIPAFSLERTQSMLFEINNFVEQGRIEPIPTFLDSPLAIAVTELYREHSSYLKKDVQEQIRGGDDIFDFPKLKFTRRVADSQEIAEVPGPKIIIAGSGMSHGGRIRTHEKRYLGEQSTTVLLVGYQSVGSVGRLLQDGAKSVRIDGEEVRVHARIATITGYSGHADRDALVDFVAEGGAQAEQVFVTMGEERAALFLVQRLRDYLGVNAVAPEEGSVVEIAF